MQLTIGPQNAGRFATAAFRVALRGEVRWGIGPPAATKDYGNPFFTLTGCSLAMPPPSCHISPMQGIAAHFGRLLKLLRRRGHSREDAEDLIQDAFLSLHSYCQKAEVRSTEGFLVRAVLNRSISLNRDQHRDRYVDEPLDVLPLTDQGPAPEEVISADQRLERITRALESVGPRTRDMFLMHRLWGFSYPEIAKQLGVTVSAVERRIARAINAVTVELHRD